MAAPFATFRSAGLVLPTLLALAGLAVLIGLGTWQLERKAWKDELVARIAVREGAPPVTLDDALALWSRDGAAAEYQRVAVTARGLAGLDRLYYAPDSKLGAGHRVFTPFEVAGAMDAGRTGGGVIWVDRGFLPDAVRAQTPDVLALPATPIAIVGRLRAPGRRGTFDPDNDVAANRWYWRDLPGMHASAFPGAPPPLPFFLEAESVEPGPGPDGWPRPAREAARITNRHLEYAVTWYGLAATLIGVFAAFAWQRLSRARPEG
jgi:surfeit locus 1 family protein